MILTLKNGVAASVKSHDAYIPCWRAWNLGGEWGFAPFNPRLYPHRGQAAGTYAGDVNPPTVPSPTQTLKQIAWLGFWILCISQALAYGVYYGIQKKEQLFIEKVIQAEATLLSM